MEERIEFSWHDYGVFGLMLALSTTVGVYFGFIKRQVTSNDYLLGGKNMSIIPVSSSLIARYAYLFCVFLILLFLIFPVFCLV